MFVKNIILNNTVDNITGTRNDKTTDDKLEGVVHHLHLEHAVHHVHHAVRGLIVDIDNVGHSQHAGDGDLVGEGSHGDPLPRPGDEGGGARGESFGEESSTRHVAQENRLQSNLV